MTETTTYVQITANKTKHRFRTPFTAFCQELDKAIVMSRLDNWVNIIMSAKLLFYIILLITICYIPLVES